MVEEGEASSRRVLPPCSSLRRHLLLLEFEELQHGPTTPRLWTIVQIGQIEGIHILHRYYTPLGFLRLGFENDLERSVEVRDDVLDIFDSD